MIRHRQGGPVRNSNGGDDSSDEEEDAFSALAKRKKKTKKTAMAVVKKPIDSEPQQQQQTSSNSVIAKAENGPSEPSSTDASKAAAAASSAERQLPLSTTSSMKRHHKELSDSRKAKMDALLMELEKEKRRAAASITTTSSSASSAAHYHGQNQHYVPDKKGSFVAPGEEGVTTNLFVGNLAPSISEEDLTELFRQFGDLYSVKIMWPRTSEERARQRHTGFVCFMNRQDAEDALQSCDNADPFNVGRRITLRWGKNVKKIVKKGAGGTLIAPILQKQVTAGVTASLSSSTASSGSNRKQDDANDSSRADDATKTTPGTTRSLRAVYNAQIHETGAIKVVIPKDPKRAQFISIVASFVAKDGSALERALVEREAGKNPAFDFLSWAFNSDNNNSTNTPQQQQQQQEEHIFYKWRVYALCQGDGYYTWQMDPFVMFEPHGCFWIPPPMDQDKAQREKEQVRIKEEAIEREKQQRRLRNSARQRGDYATGRKLEQGRNSRGGPDGGAMLSAAEMLEFHRLLRQQLCASREAICEAMAFCFEKSAAAKQLSHMIKDLLLELGPGTSVETRIARLYLLSDILFNTQQPGVRLAFFYRDAIERMAPEVFAALGKNTDGALGRMSLNKLSNAVSSVLAAWTNWSVYDPSFLDELQSRFEGREIEPMVKKETEEESQEDHGGQNQKAINSDEEAEHVIVTKPQGQWKEASADQNEIDLDDENAQDDADGIQLQDDDGAPLDDEDGAPLDDEDGAPSDDEDGAPLDDEDGAPLDEEDGAPLDDEDGAQPPDDEDGATLDENDHDDENVPLDVDDTVAQH